MLSLARQIVSKSARAAVGRAVTTSVVAAETTAGPSVKDLIVTLTFVDPSGARRKVPAVVGTWQQFCIVVAYCYFIIVV